MYNLNFLHFYLKKSKNHEKIGFLNNKRMEYFLELDQINLMFETFNFVKEKLIN